MTDHSMQPSDRRRSPAGALASDLYPHLNPLTWGDADRAQRASLAQAADRVILGHLRLPAPERPLADVTTLDSSDFRRFLDSALTNAVEWQRHLAAGRQPAKWGRYPAPAGFPQIASEVTDSIVGRFQADMTRYGRQLRSEGHNGQGIAAFTHHDVMDRTGAPDLGAIAAEAARDGFRQEALSEPRPQQVAAVRGSPRPAGAQPAQETLPDAAAPSAAPASGVRSLASTRARQSWTREELAEWQGLGTQLGGMTARLETEGLRKARWEPAITRRAGSLPDETPESVATNMDASVASRLGLDLGSPREHLADPALIEKGRYVDYAQAAISRGLDVAYPVSPRLRGEAADTVARSFAEGHGTEMRRRRRLQQQRPENGFEM